MKNNFHIADFYDSLYKDKPYYEEIKFCLHCHGETIRSNHTALEIGSGTGNHTIHLSTLFSEVLAVEKDMKMMELGQKKTKENKNISWVHSNIKSLNLGQHFTHAFALFNVVNYMQNEEELILSLKKIQRALKNGGVFFFDSWASQSTTVGTARQTRKFFFNGKIHEVDIDGENINPSDFVYIQKEIFCQHPKNLLFKNKIMVRSSSQRCVYRGWFRKCFCDQ